MEFTIIKLYQTRTIRLVWSKIFKTVMSRCPGRHFNLHSVQGIDFTFDQAKTNSSFYQTVSSYMLVTRNLSACIETSRNVDELEI